MKLLISFVLVICWSVCWGQNPGIQVQVNGPGIDLVRRVATRELDKKLKTFNRLPDQRIDEHTTVSRISLYNINIGSTNATTISPNKFHLSARGATISGRANVRYSRRILFARINLSGTVTVTASNIRIQTDFILGRSSSGKPTLSATNIDVTIGDFDIKLRGSIAARLVNLFVGLFEDFFRRKLEELIEKAIRDFVSDFNRDELTEFDVFPDFAGFKINLAQVRPPRVNSIGIIVFFNGQIFSANRNTPPSLDFQARYVPTLPATSKMAQILISDYVFDTMLHTLWLDGRLRVTLTQDQIERILGGTGQLSVIPFLNPNQGSGFGSLEESMEESIISGLEIRIFAISAPDARISQSGIEITTPFRIDIIFDLSDTVESFILNLTIRANLFATSNGIGITKDSLEITLVGEGTEISASILSLMNGTNLIDDQYLAAYEAATSGFQPFEKFDYYFRNPMVDLANGYIIVGTDFVHTPSG